MRGAETRPGAVPERMVRHRAERCPCHVGRQNAGIALLVGSGHNFPQIGYFNVLLQQYMYRKNTCTSMPPRQGHSVF
jgi:hypothetical protein